MTYWTKNFRRSFKTMKLWMKKYFSKISRILPFFKKKFEKFIIRIRKFQFENFMFPLFDHFCQCEYTNSQLKTANNECTQFSSNNLWMNFNSNKKAHLLSKDSNCVEKKGSVVWITDPDGLKIRCSDLESIVKTLKRLVPKNSVVSHK